MTISNEQLESLRASAQRIADTQRDEAHAERQRITIDAESLTQLITAVTPALPFVTAPVQVLVAPNVQRSVTIVGGSGIDHGTTTALASLGASLARRAIKVLGDDFVTVSLPVYAWPRASAVYLDRAGNLFELVRTAPDKPDDQAPGAWGRDREDPRCGIHTTEMTAEMVVTQYKTAVVEVAKVLNRYMSVMETK